MNKQGAWNSLWNFGVSLAKIFRIIKFNLLSRLFLPLIITFFLQIFNFRFTMAMANRQNRGAKLPPEVNRILYIKNLPYKITTEEMYEIFGKFGAVRQIRV